MTKEILERASAELRKRGLPVFFPLAFTCGLVSEADGSWTGNEDGNGAAKKKKEKA